MPDDDISLPALADLIEKDTLISGKILSIANSAAYSRGQGTYSIRHAVARLGLNRIRNTVLGLSVTRVWSGVRVPDRFSMLRFNQHALATATMSDLLVERVSTADAEQAFLAGLFHDIGQLFLASMYPVEYDTILQREYVGGLELEQCERDLFGFSHCDVSARTIAIWNLPEPIQVAALYHERPPDASAPTSREFPLGEVVHAADVSVAALGFSLVDWVCDDTAARQALAPLGLDDTEISAEFFHQFSAFRSVA